MSSRQGSSDGDQDTDERQALVAETADSDRGPSIEASPVCQLQCLVLSLALVAVGFVAALNEATVTYLEKHDVRANTSGLPWYKRDNPSLWACLIVKCVQLSMGIGSLIYLLRWVMRDGKIEGVIVCNPSISPTRYKLGAIRRFQELPASLSSYPTKMFVSIFIIFAILGILGVFAETSGDLIDAIDPLVYEILPYVDVFRCALLILFIGLQIIFFVVNSRYCLNWKLKSSWTAMSLVLSTNLSLWFFYVSHEISEIASQNHSCIEYSTAKQEFREQLSTTAEILYPFLIEFFLMSAILSGSFLSNAGRFSRLLRDIQRNIGCLTREAIRDKLYPLRTEADQPDCQNCCKFCCKPAFLNVVSQLCKHRKSLLFGVSLVVTALIISVPMKLLVCDREPWHIVSTYILVSLFLSGSIFSIVLLRVFSSAGEASAEAKARTAADRLMLWFCVFALVTNDLNRFWGVFGSDKDLPNAIGTGLVTVFDICQSVLQVYLLECILLKRIRSSDVLVGGSLNWGKQLLTGLMVINALEWLISAVAFSLFFFEAGRSLSASYMALAVISAPLQVFFRFHSVGCIHEFRKHCRENNEPEGQEQPPSIPINFPTLTPSSNYGAIV